ncbi:hypothetical protein DFQ30_002264 [Apophysomyces sp. BC1015]|nr:hypothetical protein DFQ30_002264 [Apophysomyces sp. BC1015]
MTYRPPLKKQQILTDIPSMITERKERSMVFDERSMGTSSERALHPGPPALKKSHSAMSLPRFCRQNAPFPTTDGPSPTDLVEQLFMAKQPDLRTSS